MSDIASPFTLGLFLGTAALFFTSAAHDAVGTGKGAGSAILEKEAAIQEGKPVTRISTKPVIVYVMGVCGCGKSTVGTGIAQLFGIPYVDGDTLHSEANIAKMGNGIPLQDEDRVPWLQTLFTHSLEQIAIHPSGCVVAASCLKKVYRDIQRGQPVAPGGLNCLPDGLPAHPKKDDVRTVFVYLQGSRDVLKDRMRNRKGHYMKEEMLNSQLATLEEPPKEGENDVIVVSIDQHPDKVIEEAHVKLTKLLAL